jgi:hypothetical protein
MTGKTPSTRSTSGRRPGNRGSPFDTFANAVAALHFNHVTHRNMKTPIEYTIVAVSFRVDVATHEGLARKVK